MTQLTATWEVSPKIRTKAALLSLDLDGFTGCWKKHHIQFDDKQKQHEYHLKNKHKGSSHEQRKMDQMLLKGKLKPTKSNIRKVRKRKCKELEVEEITTEHAAEYLQILQKIRDGVVEPQSKKTSKHLPNVTVNKAKIKHYLRRIKQLQIVPVYDIEKRSQLPPKETVDGWYTELSKMYDEICHINNSDDPTKQHTLLYLTLFEALLLSFGKIGRLHKMLTIYEYLKSVNLHVSNATLTEMVGMVQHDSITCRELYNAYLNDFRKGKIAERPTLQLFNALIAAQPHSTSTTGDCDVSMLFKMLTHEFKMQPDADTILNVLRTYALNSPPWYKSAQRLMKEMRTVYGVKANAEHYAQMLSMISTSWRNFSKSYVDLEEMTEAELKHYRNGVDLKRCMKVFHTILQQKHLQLNSKVFSAIIKACFNAKHLGLDAKRDLIEVMFNRYILLSDEEDDEDGSEMYENVIVGERFLEISDMRLGSEIGKQLLGLSWYFRNYAAGRKYYDILTTDSKVRDRFEVDCDLFVTLIQVISCDQTKADNAEEYEQEVLRRIEWTEREMEKHDILADHKIWYEWLMLAKRLNMPSITDRILRKMDAFTNNVRYFEFNMHLLQALVEALYANNEMEKALAFYDKYYRDIKLFSHWHLKVTGQKEIDFHGFRAGFACVALQWILQNEYPPLNISKYLLEKYGNENPNIHLIIGQGHHNREGESKLYKKISKFIDSLHPKIQASRYPNNPGQLVLNGDDVVRWRKYHGHQVDALEVNKHLRFKLFV